MTRDEAMDAFIEAFRRAVRRRAPQGNFVVPLSGGRDSRHILLELCEAGYRPKSCVTMRHLPPRHDEDARVATLLAATLGVDHEVLSPATSFVRAEKRKNVLSGYCTDWNAWMLTLLDHVEGQFSDLYSGYGGDALCRGGSLDKPTLTFWQARDVEGLANHKLVKNVSRELALKLILQPEAQQRFGIEQAGARLVPELQRHLDQPNPDLAYVFHNALRRRTGPKIFPMSSNVAHVFVPYLDDEVFDLLASLPLEMWLDRAFHTEAIWRAFPRFKEVPFEGTSVPRQNDGSYFKQLADELTALALSRQTSKMFHIPRLVERLSGCRRSGDGTLLHWLQPARILCLLQLEEAIETVKCECEMYEQSVVP